jgi:site-specific DNA recombinase
MIGAAIYVRVSTAAQGEEGSSLGTQETACRSHAAIQGYTVDEAHVYRETFSGTQLWERPELTRLRAAIRERQVEALVCYAIDRLSRDPVHLGVILSEADHHHVAVAFVTEPFDDSPEGQLIRFVRGYAAKVEHEKIRERAIRGRRARAAAGKLLPGPRPLFGYRWPDASRASLSIDPVTAPIVSRLFAEVLAGKSLRQIADGLAADGILSPTGRPRWAIGVISRMLRHPAYSGRGLVLTERHGNQYYLRGTQTLELPAGVIPPLVTPAEQDAVCEQFDRNRAQASRYSRYPERALVRGIVRCAHCGYPMRVRRDYAQPERQVLIYRCESEHRRETDCTPHHIRVERVDTEVWSRVRDYLLRAAAAEWQPDVGPDTSTANLSAVERSISEIARRQSNLTRELGSASDDPYLPDLIRAQLAELGSRRTQLEEERAKLLRYNSDREANRARLMDLATWSRQWAVHVDELAYGDRRLLLDAFGVEVIVRRGKGQRVKVALTRVPDGSGGDVLSPTARYARQDVWLRLP